MNGAELPSTIAEAGTWLRTGRYSVAELTSGFLSRIRASQDVLGAFITVTDESALEWARRLDDEFARGMDRGPLHGIPFAIKDLIATEDAPTTANSRALDPSWNRRSDATVVRKLRAAGAISLGKVALHEFANGWADPDEHMPMARNPWDINRSPGGSSTGSGTAVAAGLVLGALGTDSAGSVRGPAAFSGVSSIKPTYGRVSRDGCVPLSYSLDAIGPLARSAWDCALMLDAMAGSDRADPTASDRPVPSMTAMCNGSLQGLRIGVPQRYFMSDEVDAQVKSSVLDALAVMSNAGADVRDLDLPYIEEANAATYIILRCEAFAVHKENLRIQGDRYSKHTRRLLQLGAFFSAADYVQAQRVRSVIQHAWTDALSNVDIVVTPTMPSVATLVQGHDPDAKLGGPSLNGPFNLVGLPAMSIPSRPSESHLPIGLQLVGKPFDEPLVFRVGDAYQRLTDWHTRTPDSIGPGVSR